MLAFIVAAVDSIANFLASGIALVGGSLIAPSFGWFE